MRNDDITKAVYEGNGVTTRWSIPFDYFAESEIHVLLTVTVAGLEQETEVDSDSFTIDGDAKEIVYPNSAGEEPVPAGTKLTVYRSTDTLQQADYTNQGAMWPETLEGSLDKIHQVLQEHSEGLARSFTVSMSANKTPKEYADELIAGSIAAVEAAAGAANSEAAAANSATAAAGSAAAALASQQAAGTSATNAAASEAAAAQSAIDIETAVATATTKAAEALASQQAAATSETNAAGSASAASASQTAAANSATAAATSATNASNSATAAAGSATSAAGSATEAAETAASINHHAGYRKASTTYAEDAMATHATLPYGWYLEATTGGTTSANDLVITSPSVGDTVTDGTVVWTIRAVASTADIPAPVDISGKANVDLNNLSAAGEAKIAEIPLTSNFTIIYPNGGSEANPANVTTNSRYVETNPFPGYYVNCVVELLYENNWGNPCWDGSTGNGPYGYGAKANQLNDNNIVLQTANMALFSRSKTQGNPFGWDGTSIESSLPCRIKVWKIGKIPD